jgi:hypothetical protein
MTKQQELEAIANDTTGIYTTAQKAKAQAALTDSKPHTEELLDPNIELWAGLARSNANPERRAQMFADFRQQYAKDPVALRSFTPERENLRVRRLIWDPITWQVAARLYDEEIAKIDSEESVTEEYVRSYRSL